MRELNSNAGEPLMTTEEAAAYLGYAVQTVYNKVGEAGNPLPCVRLGRSLRFRRSELDQWVNDQNRAAA